MNWSFLHLEFDVPITDKIKNVRTLIPRFAAYLKANPAWGSLQVGKIHNLVREYENAEKDSLQ